MMRRWPRSSLCARRSNKKSAMPDLRGLLIRLAEADFPFVVVGGYAAAAHGATLVTQDLDVCCMLTDESLPRLHEAVGDLHPVQRDAPNPRPLPFASGFPAGLKNLYLDTDLGPLDLLGEIKGIGGYAEVLAHSMEVKIAGQPVRVLSLDGIIAAKEAMDRPRDRAAAAELKAIRDLDS